MTVEYEEAMRTLSTMFASVDQEIIDAVLRANQWHMERTIDALLSMSDATTGAPAQKEALPSDIPPPQPKVDPQQIQQDEMLARALQNELFLSEVRTNEEFNGMLSTNRESSPDASLKEVKEKFNELGEAAKQKLRDLSTIFFTKTKYQGVPTNDSSADKNEHVISEEYLDDEEVVVFDARHVRRRNQVLSDEEDEEPSPHLVDRRRLRQALTNGDAQ